MIRVSTLLVLGGLLASEAQAQTPITLGPATEHPMGRSSVGLFCFTVADLNSDGKQDVLATDFQTDSVRVRLGNGDGTFQALSVLSTTGNSLPIGNFFYLNGVATGDMNGDGRPDIITSNKQTNKIGILLGSASGGFQTPATYACSSPFKLIVADLNGDGHLDVATTSVTQVLIMLGTGTGALLPAVAYTTDASHTSSYIASADLNGDGKPDLVTLNQNAPVSPYPSSLNTVSVLLSTSNGTFMPSVNYPFNNIYPSVNFALADLNRDGHPDIVTTAGFFQNQNVLLGNANGTFQPPTPYPIAPGMTWSNHNAVADLNGDQKPDLLYTHNNTSQIGISLGNGSGAFPAGTSYSFTTCCNRDIAAADFNRDGRPDVITLNNNTLAVMLNTTPLAARATLPGASATLYPNPTSTSATLTLGGLPAAVAQVQATLFDATGRAVGQQQLAAAQGTARADVPTAGLAAGLYVLRLTAYDALGQPAGSLPAQRLSVR